ncbi:CydC: thiol reductant ABC exporter, CydC subunit [Rubrobacter radiotolerans]|uniref:CydC: thiol reductant ABC exporter, CydC subunit n=1 Tax=Rubrobacter radiotolerans TaxID=42256 RepID=A0A023X2T3_RUBRA|nr:thiol reductant ABC exporter subunit CydC [Rubrobacter radiotolerans]AHY46633.1 CydC: thiol reductant ABC exporter, CydC subunit [Rubrobacter radiotolerans]MDX5894040.1 thiol reductant ABC exporter subunit CydC [Rubrobacter radiotolerans]SMC05042.1 ATP-binding cassette, subfamily C, CydC [Rubrobacter radiotolerans DSM 5868]
MGARPGRRDGAPGVTTVRGLWLLLGEAGARRRAALGLLFACVAAGASVGLVALAGWFIAASALAGIAGAATFVVAYPSSGIRAFAALRVVFRYLERLTNHRVTFSLLSLLRVRFFFRALALPRERFARYRSGDLLGRVTSDVDALDGVFPRVAVPTLAALVVCVGAVGLLAYHSLLLAAVLAAGCVLAGVVAPFLAARLARGAGAGISSSRASLTTELVETLEGLPEVRSYGAGDLVAARLGAAVDSLARAERRAKRVDAAGVSAGTLVAQGTVLGVLLLGVPLAVAGGISGPVLALVALLALGTFELLGTLPTAYRALGVSRAASQRLGEVFDGPEPESAGRRAFPTRSDGLGAGVSVREVRFRYRGAERLALDGFSFDAEPGSFVALVGPSGSGKSTLLGLLAGELRAGSGSVCYGGVPVEEISPSALTSRVAYAAQDEHLFDATLRDNLALAEPSASDEVLLYVLDLVGLADFYRGLEAGLDTPLGEGGREVSGGQRRRIAVARALLRRPDVLLLDEPTGSLDRKTARAMVRRIRENLPRATVVLATHDPDLVLDAVPEARVVRVGGSGGLSGDEPATDRGGKVRSRGL